MELLSEQKSKIIVWILILTFLFGTFRLQLAQTKLSSERQLKIQEDKPSSQGQPAEISIAEQSDIDDLLSNESTLEFSRSFLTYLISLIQLLHLTGSLNYFTKNNTPKLFILLNVIRI